MTTLPNLLTLSRIGVTPILLALLYFHRPVTRWVALVLFVAAGLTDFLDGYLARHRGEVSAFGRILGGSRGEGIEFSRVTNSTIWGTMITAKPDEGIKLGRSDNTTITGNNWKI